MIPLLKRKKRVILDTNMLLLPGKGTDILDLITHKLHESFQFYMVERTYEELESLMETAKKGSDKFNAKLGFIMAKQKGIKTLASTKHHVDDAILEVLTKNDYIATLDKKLQKQVLNLGAKIIVVRNKNQVEIK